MTFPYPQRPLWREVLVQLVPILVGALLHEATAYAHARRQKRTGQGVCGKCGREVDVLDCVACTPLTSLATTTTVAAPPMVYGTEGVDWPEDD